VNEYAGPPDAPNPETVPGPGGRSIADWLAEAVAFGSIALSTIVEGALKKRVASGQVLRNLGWIFDAKDRAALNEVVEAVIVPSDLVGRTRFYGSTGNVTLPEFAEAVAELRPLKPHAAIRYFSSLVPRVGQNPNNYAQGIQREVFNVAVTTEDVVTKKIQQAIANELVGGQDATLTVEGILKDAGISPLHSQYSQMVVRTNVMDALNRGQQDELNASGMRAEFPAWQYHAIRDERTRPWHREKDGLYYPISTPFVVVRGLEAKDVCNCRCNWTPIHKLIWNRLAPGKRELQRTGEIPLAW